MKLSPEEAWAGTLESMVDNRVVFYLRRYNRDYQDYSRQMKELCEKYPAIICTFRINGAPFPRQRCKRLAPAVRYPFVVTC